MFRETARWVCEQAHRQLKEERGLDHFEGRSWTGLHRHALMACIACACLPHLRPAGLDRTGRGKRWPAYRDRRRLRARQPCVRPSSVGCSRRLSRPCDVRTVGAASGCHLTSRCRGSDRLRGLGIWPTKQGSELPGRDDTPALPCTICLRPVAAAAKAEL